MTPPTNTSKPKADAPPSEAAVRRALGPAVAGSSRELLDARVVRGGYPLGYTPKRSSKTMPRFEHLADQMDALAAYLAEAGS